MGVEALRGIAAIDDPHVPFQLAVKPVHDVAGRYIPRHICMSHLAGGVYAGIGTAGSDDSDIFAHHGGKGIPYITLHRPQFRLYLPTVKPGTIIFDGENYPAAAHVN